MYSCPVSLFMLYKVARSLRGALPHAGVESSMVCFCAPENFQAGLIQKIFEIDPSECTRCGAIMRIIALIDDSEVIERILKHLDVSDSPPGTIIGTRQIQRISGKNRKAGNLPCAASIGPCRAELSTQFQGSFRSCEHERRNRVKRSI